MFFLPASYVFHVPEVDIYVKTKKVWGGKFYVMFSEKKNISFFLMSIILKRKLDFVVYQSFLIKRIKKYCSAWVGEIKQD